MHIGQIDSNINIGDLSVSSKQVRTQTGLINHSITLPAGKTGTLSTRTSDTAGILTLEAGHGITVADKVNVFWADGVAYNFTVSDVTGNDVTIASGSGDVLPTEAATIIAAARVEINTDFDGDDMVMIAVFANKRAHIDFLDVGPASLKACELIEKEAWTWASNMGIDNPLTGNPVDTIQTSAGTTGETTLKIAVLYDSTP